MRIGRPFAGIVALAGLLSSGPNARAMPPADDFIRAQKPGPHLTLMPFVGPGFRATYDHRFDLDKAGEGTPSATELRTQVMGTVAIPFAEVSANADLRLFLMTFGASVGYHDEWHVLQYRPDSQTGYDRAGQPTIQASDDPNSPLYAPTYQRLGFNNLDRNARSVKDQNADEFEKGWAYYEARWGFVWPAYNFTGVSTFAARHDGRPNETYDWENGTVLNGGWNFRWEGYAFFQGRNFGFIGPALRAMVVPRYRTKGEFTTPAGNPLPDHSACQPGVVEGLACYNTHEFEFHYGIIAGLRPNWVSSNDTFLFRAYAAWGLDDRKLFGTQVFRQPIQILFAYMVDIDL